MSLYVTITAWVFAISLMGNVARGMVNGWSTPMVLDVIMQAILVTWAASL